jgi:hypothetical protein
MASFVGTAHTLWQSLSPVDVPGTFFERSAKALKSDAWILRSMRGPFSDSFLATKSRARLWMQTYYLKAGAEVGGLGEIAVHVSKPVSRAQSADVDRLLTTLVATVKLCAVLFGPCPAPALEVVAVLTDTKKRIPSDRRLTTEAINSGFTRHGAEPVVVVFRREECHKVLVHELFHFWRVHGDAPAGLVVPAFVPRGALLQESYVEALATLAVCAYTAGSVGHVKARIAAEAAHSEAVRARVEGCDAGDTNAWAYFVGKCYLMRRLPDFVDAVERSPGLRTAAQWQAFVSLMAAGHGAVPQATAPARVAGLVRMVACDPE